MALDRLLIFRDNKPQITLWIDENMATKFIVRLETQGRTEKQGHKARNLVIYSLSQVYLNSWIIRSQLKNI